MSDMAAMGVARGAMPAVRIGPTGRIGIGMSIFLLAALLGWMRIAMIGGAVVAPGEVVVRGQPKDVQSLDGGLVATILVSEGDRVAAGDPLMTLDATLAEIELGMERGRLAGAILQERRLQAEYVGASEIDFEALPEEIAGMDLTIERAGQGTIFAARRAVLAGLSAQLETRVEQADQEIAGIDAQLASLTERRALLAREIATTESLLSRNLARESDLLELKSRRSSIEGEIASLRSARLQAEAAVRDARLESMQAARRFRETAVTELREASLERARHALAVATLEKRIERMRLTAPVGGIVHDLRVATIGGVIPPGESAMQIVPLGQGFEFTARVDPRSIDAVHVGQRAKIVFPAFDMRTTPEIFGTVSNVPPGATVDQASGNAHYHVTLTIPDEEIARLGEVDLIPGMPMEAFLQTGERSMLSYLLRPISDQMRRAMKED